MGLGIEDRTEDQSVAAQRKEVVEPGRQPGQSMDSLTVGVRGRVGPDKAEWVHMPPDRGAGPALCILHASPKSNSWSVPGAMLTTSAQPDFLPFPPRPRNRGRDDRPESPAEISISSIGF